MSDGGVHSTGRGGAGNIGKEADPTSYVDASIVREGVYGASNGADYSAGRGGAGNIGRSPDVRPADSKVGEARASTPLSGRATPRADTEMVPETAMRSAEHGGGGGSYHTGRGGAGNEIHAKKEGSKEGFVGKVEDKVKHMLHKEK